jgi:hypothetical protein
MHSSSIPQVCPSAFKGRQPVSAQYPSGHSACELHGGEEGPPSFPTLSLALPLLALPPQEAAAQSQQARMTMRCSMAGSKGVAPGVVVLHCMAVPLA